jgi:hypothetical protein
MKKQSYWHVWESFKGGIIGWGKPFNSLSDAIEYVTISYRLCKEINIFPGLTSTIVESHSREVC